MAASHTALLPPEGRRLETPARATLLAHYAETERFSKIILAGEVCITVAALLWVSFGTIQVPDAWPWVAATLGGLGVFRWIAQHVFLNKKRLEDIRADASFGVHNKQSLLALVQRVFSRLQLPPDAAPVFMTRAKDVNAMAVRCELLPGLRVFNGVYLNRAIIHLLDEPELESVVGHELGHVFPYAPLLSRSYLLHSAFAASVSFALAATFNHGAVAVIAPLALLWVLDWIIAFPHIRISRGIEFLCDDFGAKAAGLLPALSSEFKINAESEARQQIIFYLLQTAAQGGKVPLDQLMEDYEAAVPFGRSDPASVRAEMEKLASSRNLSRGGVSLTGFVRFLGERDVDDDDYKESVGNEAKRLELLATLPLVPIDRESYLKDSSAWTTAKACELITVIENNPTTVLFHLADEITDKVSSHPGVSRRMLFLWRNQQT